MQFNFHGIFGRLNDLRSTKIKISMLAYPKRIQKSCHHFRVPFLVIETMGTDINYTRHNGDNVDDTD